MRVGLAYVCLRTQEMIHKVSMRIAYRGKRENTFAAIFRLLQRCVPTSDASVVSSPRLNTSLPQPVCTVHGC